MPKTLIQFLEYRDLEALADGFAEDEVEGLLLDAFVASYMLNNDWATRINSVQFERVKILDRPFPIGLYAPRFKKLHEKLESDLQRGIKNYHDRDIYAIAYQYVRSKFNVSSNYRHRCTPYSKMVANKLFFCLHVN